MGSVIPRAAAEGTALRPEPVRLALVAPYAPSIVSFKGALIRILLQNGAQVWVFAPDYTPAIREQIRLLGAIPVDYPMDRTGANPFSDLHTLWSLVRMLKQIRPDVFLSYNIKPVIYGSLASWLTQCPKRVAWIKGLGYNFYYGRQDRPQASIAASSGSHNLSSRAENDRFLCFQNPDDPSLTRATISCLYTEQGGRNG